MDSCAAPLTSRLKPVLEVWMFIIAFFTIAYLAASRTGTVNQQQIPSSFSLPLAITLVDGALASFVPIMLFLVYFVRHYERRDFRSTISSLGLNRNGIGRSVLWSMVFMAGLMLVVVLWEGALVGLFGSAFATALGMANKVPSWYAAVLLVSILVNAVMEESIGRGYMLDRLMPSHPAGLLASLPAILGVSVLGMLYHVPTYVIGYQFSPLSLLFNFGVTFLSFTFVGLAYVRSRVRNISGPILIHFLLDATPYLLLL